MRIIFVLVIFTILVISISTNEVLAKIQDKKEIHIASWNMLNFGETRSKVDSNLEATAEILIGKNYPIKKNYDIIFVQELKSNGIGFEKLCQEYLEHLGYKCQRTEQISGKGSNNESYGVIYREGIDVFVEDTGDEDTFPYIPQGKSTKDGQMVRPPMKATVTVDDEFTFVAYNNHIIPGNPETKKELELLEKIIEYESGDVGYGNIVVLGDLNADSKKTPHPDGTKCSSDYLDGGFEKHPTLFNEPHWLRIFTVENYTNFANPCSYDKIIPNDNMANSFTGKYGIIDETPEGVSFGKYPKPGYKVGDKHISDHKLIWAEFTLGGIESTDLHGDSQEIFSSKSSECGVAEDVFVRGEGFAPNKSVDVYVTDFTTNENIDGIYFEYIYPLEDVRGEPTVITTDDEGEIPTTSIWTNPTMTDQIQGYNVIVDVDQNEEFTNSIDVIDVYDYPGFLIKHCGEESDESDGDYTNYAYGSIAAIAGAIIYEMYNSRKRGNTDNSTSSSTTHAPTNDVD